MNFKRILAVGLLLTLVTTTITPAFARGGGGGGRGGFSGGRSFSSSSFSSSRSSYSGGGFSFRSTSAPRTYTSVVRTSPSKSFSLLGFGRPKTMTTTVKTKVNPFTGKKTTVVTKTIVKAPRKVIVTRPSRYYHSGHYYNSYSGHGVPMWYWYYLGMSPNNHTYVDGYDLERANCRFIKNKKARKACFRDKKYARFYN